MPSVVLQCDAVLFDMDGTLVDSRALVERMWLRWAERRRVSPEAILAVAHGRRTLETMQIVAPQFATPEEAAQLDAEEEEEAREHGGETAVAGAASLLRALPAARWAIVTSAVGDIARRRVAGVGLPVPHVLVGAADVSRESLIRRGTDVRRTHSGSRRPVRGRGGHASGRRQPGAPPAPRSSGSSPRTNRSVTVSRWCRICGRSRSRRRIRQGLCSFG